MEEEGKVIKGDEHIGMEEYLDEADINFSTPKYSPITIIDYNSITDSIYLEDTIYKDRNNLYKYKKTLKFSSSNNEIVKILRDCYDNEVWISNGNKQMLVINKNDMWEYINAIKYNTGRRYYSVDIKKNKSSSEEWVYLNELKIKIKKAKVWDNFSELKSLYLDKKKWEKINKHYEEKGKYLGIKYI
jgi:hypothetical protein